MCALTLLLTHNPVFITFCPATLRLLHSMPIFKTPPVSLTKTVNSDSDTVKPVALKYGTVKRMRAIPLGISLIILGGCASLASKPPQQPATPKVVKEEPEVPARPFEPDTLYDLLVAEFAGKRNRPEVALGKYLKQAHKTRDPNVSARATRIARFLGAHQAALDSALLWSQIEPENIEARQITASELMETGQTDRAIELTDKLLKDKSDLNCEFLLRGVAKTKPEQQPALLAKIQQLTLRYPGNASLWFVQGGLEQAVKKPRAALASFQNALDAMPDYTNAILAKAQQMVGLNQNEAAIAFMSDVVKDYPGDKRLGVTYARLLIAAKRYDDAQVQFGRLAARFPRDPDLVLSVALISMENKLYDSAKVQLNRLRKMSKRTAEANFYLGQIAAIEEHPEEAIYHYGLVPHGPLYMQARIQLASLLAQSQQLKKSRAVMAALRQEQPEQTAVLYRAESEILAEAEAHEQAVELLTEALAQFPDDHKLRYNRAMFAGELDRFNELEADLKYVLQRDPDNVSALNALGYVYADRNQQLQQAREMVEKAFKLSPKDPAIIDSMGWVNYRLGNLQQAQIFLQQAYDILPDQEIAAHLVEVLWHNGQQQKAKDLWKTAIKKDPDSDLLKKLTTLLNSK